MVNLDGRGMDVADGHARAITSWRHQLQQQNLEINRSLKLELELACHQLFTLWI